MRTIKPGKLATSDLSVRKKKSQSAAPANKRDIWDDYLVTKKGSRKKEYEPDRTGRMVQKKAPVGIEAKKGREEGDGVGVQNIVPHVRGDYQFLEEKFYHTFDDRTLLQTALTHRSVLGYSERSDYERLEFLGDAVLDLSVAHLLSDRHPKAREGDLSKMRAALVNTSALAEIGKELEIGAFIKLGKGELASGGAERPSILADVMEAIFGAIYLDGKYDEVFQVIEKVYGSSLESVTPSDPKTELQEQLHAAGSEPPTYLVELVEGPEHAPTFVTVVLVDGDIAGRGRGPTKKAAQQAAASEALSKLSPDFSEVNLKDGQSVIFEPALLLTVSSEPHDGSEPEKAAKLSPAQTEPMK